MSREEAIKELQAGLTSEIPRIIHERIENAIAILESQPEPGELTKTILALTNGVGEKPYCRRVDGQMIVFVADDQEFCRIALIDEYDEEIAQAICDAGLLLKSQRAEIERLKAEENTLVTAIAGLTVNLIKAGVITKEQAIKALTKSGE